MSAGTPEQSIDNRPSLTRSEAPVDELNASIGRFVTSFERSSRRWEFVVYPALFAFVVLAAYGFFLVYSLSTDMRSMAMNVDSMSRNMQSLSVNVRQMTGRVGDMSTTVHAMSEKMDSLEPMVGSMQEMEESMRTLSVTNDLMRHEVSVMSRSVARPMSAMNKVMPW